MPIRWFADRHNAHVEILAFIVSSQNEMKVKWAWKIANKLLLFSMLILHLQKSFYGFALMNRKYKINENSIAVPKFEISIKRK